MDDFITQLCDAYRCEPLPRRLAWIRVKMEVSQKQLADSVSVDQSVISRLESGRDARLSTWIKVLAGLGCELTIRCVDPDALGDHEDERARRIDRQIEGRDHRWR